MEKEQPLSRKKVRNVNFGMQNIINNEFNKNQLLKRILMHNYPESGVLKAGLSTQP
jgi:hypothetical protein